MSGVRVLVGTRKGAFVLTSDGKRQKWDVSGPHFAGWEIYHLKGIARRPEPALRLAVQRLVRAADPALGRRRQDVGAGRQQVRLRRRPPARTCGTTARQHPWEFARVWHLEPSLTDPDTVYAGVEDAALFRSTDGGQTWQELPGLRDAQLGGLLAAGRRRDVPAHDPAGPEPSRPDLHRHLGGGRVPQRRRRHDLAADQPGPPSEQIPDPTAEVGHCVHRIAMHPSRPNVLFMQKHWDVMRSDDAGESWREVSGNLPTDFGFPIDVHAHEPETIYVVPIKSDSEHYPPDGKLRVYRSRTGGNEWEALTNGLPQSDCYVNVLRDAMAVDSLDPVRRVLRHHRRAGVRVGRRRRHTGRPSSGTFRPWCPSRSRRCHDPGRRCRPTCGRWRGSTAR